MGIKPPCIYLIINFSVSSQFKRDLDHLFRPKIVPNMHLHVWVAQLGLSISFWRQYMSLLNGRYCFSIVDDRKSSRCDACQKIMKDNTLAHWPNNTRHDGKCSIRTLPVTVIF